MNSKAKTKHGGVNELHHGDQNNMRSILMATRQKFLKQNVQETQKYVSKQPDN